MEPIISSGFRDTSACMVAESFREYLTNEIVLDLPGKAREG